VYCTAPRQVAVKLSLFVACVVSLVHPRTAWQPGWVDRFSNAHVGRKCVHGRRASIFAIARERIDQSSAFSSPLTSMGRGKKGAVMHPRNWMLEASSLLTLPLLPRPP